MRAALIVGMGLAACDVGARPAPEPLPPTPTPLPAALVVVINSQEIFVGNEQHETDENVRYAGVWQHVAYAFDTVAPASVLPPGSVGGVIGYSTGSEVLVPMGPLERVAGSNALAKVPLRELETAYDERIELESIVWRSCPLPRCVNSRDGLVVMLREALAR